MGLDLGLVCQLIEHHLGQHGVAAAARGREVRLDDGLTLRLRSEGKPDDDAPGSMFWVDVDGLRLEPRMSLDLSGWGATPEDQAMDASHGLLASIIPPLKWLAGEPWRPPTSAEGSVLDLIAEDGQPWTAVVGRPWVIVAAFDEGVDVGALAAEIRERMLASVAGEFEELGSWPRQLTTARRGHWIKIYAGRMPDGTVQSRVDLDNDLSIDAEDFGKTLPWHDGNSLQLIRQLIVLRPDGEAPRPKPAGRLTRLFGR